MSPLASWMLGLIFGFGLNVLDVMSFYYLFIPTWFFTIIVYILLAGRYGAKQSYPDAEKREVAFNEAVEQYHQKLAGEQIHRPKDTSLLSKGLKAIAYAALGVTLFLALKTLLASPDEGSYLTNRDTFYQIGFICTVIYFVSAYWVMQRGKSI